MNFTFLTEEEKITFERQYRLIMITGLALAGSIIVYILIANLLAPQTSSSEISIRYIFLSLALFVAIIIRIIRGIILSRQDRPTFSNLMSRLTISSIVTLALCESIAIIGLIEYFITGLKMDFYIMIFLSLVFFAVHFPRRPHWEAYINSHIKEFQR